MFLCKPMGCRFSMPHLADDDYHQRFATYVRDTLRPDVKVYVEWSNEVWHNGFAGQGHGGHSRTACSLGQAAHHTCTLPKGRGFLCPPGGHSWSPTKRLLMVACRWQVCRGRRCPTSHERGGCQVGRGSDQRGEVVLLQRAHQEHVDGVEGTTTPRQALCRSSKMVGAGVTATKGCCLHRRGPVSTGCWMLAFSSQAPAQLLRRKHLSTNLLC